MASFGNFERRHLTLDGTRTTLALEGEWWRALDRVSGGDWQAWALMELARKPEGVGRARWIRTKLLKKALRGGGIGQG